jgi:hypothetical protein
MKRQLAGCGARLGKLSTKLSTETVDKPETFNNHSGLSLSSRKNRSFGD